MTRQDRIWAAAGAGFGLVALLLLAIILRLVLEPSAPAPEEPAPLAPAPLAPRPAAAPRPAPPPTTRPVTRPTRRPATPPTTRPAPPPTTRPAPPPRWQLAETVDEMTDRHHVVLCANSDPIRGGAYDCLLAFRMADDGTMSALLVGSDGIGWEINPPAALLRIGTEPAERVPMRHARTNVAALTTDARILAERLRGSGELRIRCDTLLWEGVTFRWSVGPEYGPLLDRLLRGQGPAPAR